MLLPVLPLRGTAQFSALPWGPRTLKARLEDLHPQVAWPAASAVGGKAPSGDACADAVSGSAHAAAATPTPALRSRRASRRDAAAAPGSAPPVPTRRCVWSAPQNLITRRSRDAIGLAQIHHCPVTRAILGHKLLASLHHSAQCPRHALFYTPFGNGPRCKVCPRSDL